LSDRVGVSPAVTGGGVTHGGGAIISPCEVAAGGVWRVSSRQAVLREHMVKFGAISSKGTHITTIIMFAWHSSPVAGCLLSLIFFLKKEKKLFFGN
jgi:hypothetical protein